jgi:SAM-dependent methyltransferase
MEIEDHITTVREGYDAIAERYHQSRETKEDLNVAWLDGLRHLLPPEGRVVDLGCGAGVPISRYFAKRGYQVEGFDLSRAMIELARSEVPEADFTVASMEDLDFEAGSVDLVVSFFAIIHVPRVRHRELFSRIYGWLRPGGAALLSLGANDNPDQTEESWHGARMKWSHFDDVANLKMLEEAGLTIVWSEVEGAPSDRHLFVIAHKPV